MPSVRRVAARALRTVRGTTTSPSTRVPPHLTHIKPQDPLVTARAIINLAKEADIPVFAVPLRWIDPVRLGVPAESLSDLLTRMHKSDPTWVVSFRRHGSPWKATRTMSIPSALSVLDQDVSSVFVHHEPAVAACKPDIVHTAGAVELDIWARTRQGTYGNRNPNLHTGEVDMSKAEPTNVNIRGTLLPSFRDFSAITPDHVPFPVDAVYLWVDGEDLRWQARRDTRLQAHQGYAQPKEAVSPSRFRQHDELRYSLRSLDLYAPWIRHVWLVTDQQVPDWLLTDHPRLTVVDHTDILPSTGLPTFNSHALSANLHRIEGLAEHFLYMNDDVFFGRPVDPSYWWSADGTALVHYTQSRSPGLSVQDVTVPVQARRNATNLASPLSGIWQHRNLQHGPHPIIRSVMAEAWTRWPEELAKTTNHAFRNPADIEPVWLHNSLGAHAHLVSEGPTVTYRYVLMDEDSAPDILKETLGQRDRDVFCLNDAHADDRLSDSDRAARYRSFLNAYYPWPSQFES